MRQKCDYVAEVCSPEEFAANPARAVGAQIFAPVHVINGLNAKFVIAITYSKADEQAECARDVCRRHRERAYLSRSCDAQKGADVSSSCLKQFAAAIEAIRRPPMPG